MKPLRRSQRFRVQPLGHQNGHTQIEGRKRTYVGNELQDLEPKRCRLTEKNLRKHLKQEGEMGRTRKTPSTNSRTTITTTDRQFGPSLIQNGVVFETSFTTAPGDIGEVKTALAMKRELPASAHKDWQRIREAKRNMAFSELSLESKVVESMLLHHDAPIEYQRFRNDQWTEVNNELTTGISTPKPDVSEAYLWAAYPSKTREDFEDLAPTQYGYAMPTFAIESKGAGDPEQALKQAAYDGAVMTHAALAAEGQMSKDGSLYMRTKAITVTLTPTEICVYANHAIKDPKSGKIAYHHHRIEKLAYLDSEDEWNSAYSVLHNAQAFALKLADARLQDLESYFKVKDARLERLKTEHGRRQARARPKANPKANPKAKKNMPPPSRRPPKAKPPEVSPSDAGNLIRTAIENPEAVDQPLEIVQTGGPLSSSLSL